MTTEQTRDALAQLEAVLALSEYDVLPVMDHPLSPRDGEGPEAAMTEWIAGSVKPRHDGPYLRQFDEGDALSWWYEGRWNADSFFAGASDIQDAPWRGFSPSGLFLCQHAETLRALLGEADGVAVAKDIRAAFDLGQRYWQQADSDSMSQHRKSEATYEQFLAIRSKYPMPTITKAPAND